MGKPRMTTSVLVIGSGLAGCITSLTLADAGISVTLLNADDENQSMNNSYLAQGGIIYKNQEEEAGLLEKDILVAGRKENSINAVRYLCKHGADAVKDILLDKYQIDFANKDGELLLTKEAGHSLARILYVGDHTGKSIMDVLKQKVAENPNIQLLNNRTAIDLLTTQHHCKNIQLKYSLKNQCIGAYAFNEKTNEVETILAATTILCTGGVGQLYLHSTNVASSIGSGLSMATRAGATVHNCQYVQFHPTALYEGTTSAERRFLITEAIRGEGAKLIDDNKNSFMKKYDPRADLAPRDIVAQSIVEELLKTGEPCVYLDAANHVKQNIAKRFPTIYKYCTEQGFDIEKTPIPVVPAAHYFCGGILTNLQGKTTLERLYAVGEVACTGVHGANRLASTSLLEALVFAHSTAELIINTRKNSTRLPKKFHTIIPDWENSTTNIAIDLALIAQDWATIRNTMWNYVGITRTTKRLTRAYFELDALSKTIHNFYTESPISKPVIELFHGCQAAKIITRAALQNKKSIGCHYRKN